MLPNFLLFLPVFWLNLNSELKNMNKNELIFLMLQIIVNKLKFIENLQSFKANNLNYAKMRVVEIRNPSQ